MELLRQDFTLQFDYTRSTGPLVGEFLTGLRDRRILGARLSDGGVMVPPPEYDPFDASAISDLLPVEETGEVVHWCWVYHPRKKHPLSHPFAWALVRLDGTRYPMLHAVDAGEPKVMKSGLKVRARWAKKTVGSMTDIECFEPSA